MTDPTDEDKKKNSFSNFASMLNKVEEDDREAKKKILKDGIAEREKGDKSSIMSSKVITGTLSNLRMKAGMSAFVGTSGKIKSPRFNRDDFIELLGRELLLIGNDEFKELGGVVSMDKLVSHFEETRDNWELRSKDIPEAIEYLSKKKMIPDFEKLNKDMEIIYFRPMELSTDIKQILMAAHGIEVTKSNLLDILGWGADRLEAGLKLLESMGLAIIDEDYVFFPGM